MSCVSSRSAASRCRRSGSPSSRSTSASSSSAGSRAPSGSIRASSHRRTRPGCTRSTRCSPVQWGLFAQALHHLVLPALVLAAFNVSLLTRYTRSAVLEVVGNDYVRAARAKGLPERVVVTRYILRAALPSVVTVLGLVFANVLTGAVLVEKIFSWPGHRPVRLPGGRQSRRPRHRGRQLVRRSRLHHRQLHRRRALRRDRSEDQGPVSTHRLPDCAREDAADGSARRGGSHSRSPGA